MAFCLLVDIKTLHNKWKLWGLHGVKFQKFLTNSYFFHYQSNLRIMEKIIKIKPWLKSKLLIMEQEKAAAYMTHHSFQERDPLIFIKITQQCRSLTKGFVTHFLIKLKEFLHPLLLPGYPRWLTCKDNLVFCFFLWHLLDPFWHPLTFHFKQP